MFKKGSSIGELFGIKQNVNAQQQQQQQQQQQNNNNNNNNNNDDLSVLQLLSKTYDRAKDLLDKTNQRNEIGFEKNSDDERRQFARINEIRRLGEQMKSYLREEKRIEGDDVNERAAWTEQIKYFEEDLASAVAVAMEMGMNTATPIGIRSPTTTQSSPYMFETPESAAPTNDLRTPPPKETTVEIVTAAPVVVDLFAGFEVTPPAEAALPLDDFGDFREAEISINTESIIIQDLSSPPPLDVNNNSSKDDDDDDDDDGFFPKEELTSGLDDALDESDEFESAMLFIQEAVVSPPVVVVVADAPVENGALENPKMLRVPSFSMESNEDVPFDDAETTTAKTALIESDTVPDFAINTSRENKESIEDDDGPVSPSRAPSPSESDISLKESTSEPFTPQYSRVATPTLDLSPDAIPVSPGSPVVFGSQDQDFILQNFGIQKIAEDLEKSDEFDKVIEATESYVRGKRLAYEHTHRLKLEASNQRLYSAEKATEHLVRQSELQKSQDEAIRNDNFEYAQEVEDKLRHLLEDSKNAEDALNEAELQHAERVRISSDALSAWAKAELEASNIIDKFVLENEQKWAQERAEEKALRKSEAAARAANDISFTEEQQQLEFRANETEEALKIAVENSNANEEKSKIFAEKVKIAEKKVSQLKEALDNAERELERITNEATMEASKAEKAKRAVNECEETYEKTKAEMKALSDKLREEEQKKQNEQRKVSDDALVSKMREVAQRYRNAASERLRIDELNSSDDLLQNMVIQETTSTILSSEASSELKRTISNNARINTDLANAKRDVIDTAQRVAILESKMNELNFLKQTHAKSKEFKEASDCVHTINQDIIPELTKLKDEQSKKNSQVQKLQLQSEASELELKQAREKHTQAELLCAKSRKIRLETEMSRVGRKDDLNVNALRAALKLLLLKHPDIIH